MADAYIEKILSARVYDVSVETALSPAPTLSARLGNQVLLKREDTQPVFSFKCRGAYNKIYQLKQKQPDIAGVICASAGNHAQGVALASKHLGLKSIIVMPRTTPAIKVNAVRAHGGRAVLHGDSFDEALAHANQLQEEKGYAFIHPFDDPYTIAGQGTVGVEICRQHPDELHAVFVPIGGGGLAAGVATFMKYLRPDVKIIGVEPADSNCMQQAIARKRRVELDQVGIFADGVAVKIAGKETFRLCRKYLDDIIVCSVDEICAAIKDVFDDTRTLLEPAGALSVAGMKKYVEQTGCEGQNLVSITSGANINFDRLRHVSERAELGERREALLAVTIPERPGSFKKLLQLIGRRQVTEFNYRYADSEAAQIFVGVQLAGGDEERAALIAGLIEADYAVTDMSDNEMAKLHVRYMVGGHAPTAEDERLFRFEFPERPGALSTFLNKVGHKWNISLFHYRNHGAAYGRVLCGIQVPDDDKARFEDFLNELGYYCIPESDNPAYQAFLR